MTGLFYCFNTHPSLNLVFSSLQLPKWIQMTLPASEGWGGNSSSPSSLSSCNTNMSQWEEQMDKMYTYFYLLLFIPGLLLNTTALWVLCRHTR